jgi:hypothetical protein
MHPSFVDENAESDQSATMAALARPALQAD